MRTVHRRTTTGVLTCVALALAAAPSPAAASMPSGAAGATALTAAASLPASADRLLRQGQRGEDVRQWQRVVNRAVSAGVLDRPRLAEDGVFGPSTHGATVALQARLGVTRDGVVGPITRGGIAGLLDAGAGAGPSQDRLLRAGTRGDDVRDWQRVLNRAISAGEVRHPAIAEDGVFGPRTRQATLALQRALGVAQDGIVGPITRDGVAGLLDA